LCLKSSMGFGSRADSSEMRAEASGSDYCFHDGAFSATANAS
jgi:hypothetical protein